MKQTILGALVALSLTGAPLQALADSYTVYASRPDDDAVVRVVWYGHDDSENRAACQWFARQFGGTCKALNSRPMGVRLYTASGGAVADFFATDEHGERPELAWDSCEVVAAALPEATCHKVRP